MFSDGGFNDFLENGAGAGRIDRKADALCDEADEQRKIFVVGGVGQGPVECEIGNNPLIRPFLGTGHLGKRVIQLFQICVVVMDGGQAGGFDLQRHAELEQTAEAFAIAQGSLLDPDGTTPLGLGDEGADALTRLHQTFVAQLGDCLPYDRAADAEGLGEKMLRRQFLTGRYPALGDFLADLAGNPCRELLVSSDVAEVHRHALFRPL